MKKIENLSVRFEVANEEYINPQFTKGRCKIAYTGKNRNGSSISKESFEDALPTLKNIPVVGYYDEESGEFTGHIGKIEMKDGEFNIYYPTPVGVVPESCNVSWETVIEEDGTTNEYLCCDVLLWTGRWNNILAAYENGSGFRQSMEIDISQWSDVDGYMRIEKFIFSALCVLQNGNEPCFESSKVEFNLNKDKFKQEFSLLLDEIKNFNKEGDTVEDNKVVETEIEKVENNEEVDNTKENNEEVVENNDENIVEEETEEVVEDKFQLSHEDKEERLRVLVANNFNVDKWDVWVGSNHVYDTYFIYEIYVSGDGYKFYKANYSVDVEDNVIVDFNDVSEVFPKQIWVNVEAYSELENKFTEIQKEVEILKKEKESFEAEIGKKAVAITELEKSNSELTSYKKNIEEKQRINEVNSVITKFSQLEDIEKEELKNLAIKGEITCEELETKLFAIIGKKNFSLNTGEKKVSVSYGLKTESENNDNPYGNLAHLFN